MVGQITKLVDFFYVKPLRFIPLNTFRYAAVGGINMVFSLFIYAFCFHIVLAKADTDFGIVVVSAPVLAYLITFVITLFSGFWLTKTIAFRASELRTRTQLLRYFAVVCINLVINYLGLKLFVDLCHFYPTPSYALIYSITIVFSYLMQRFFTFR